VLLESTGQGYSQPTYEDCDIVCRSTLSDGGWGLIRGTNTGHSNPGGAVFENCRVINETDLQTVRIDPRKPDADPPQGITFDGVEIYLSGDSQPQEAIVAIGDDWDNSLITGSIIYASNGAVDGVRVRSCENVTIEDTTISVPGNLITGDVPQVITQRLSSEVPEDVPF
jgi:polygalacturonase